MSSETKGPVSTGQYNARHSSRKPAKSGAQTRAAANELPVAPDTAARVPQVRSDSSSAIPRESITLA